MENKKARNLQEEYPYLAKEFCEYLNGISPSEVPPNSNKKYHWKCSKNHNHIWLATPNKRVNARGCPKCPNKTSFFQLAIYHCLRKQLPHVLDRYLIEDNYEADIFIPELNICIEYDGYWWHKNRVEKDIYKNKVFKLRKLQLVRVREQPLNPLNEYGTYNVMVPNSRNNNVRKESPAVVKIVCDYLNTTFGLNLDSSFSNEDYRIVLEMLYDKEIHNSIVVTHPVIAKQWDYEKNRHLKPEYISIGCHEKVWWKCEKKGHSWPAAVYSRKDKGCPYCVNQKISIENSVATTHPFILKIWDYQKNDLNPANLSSGSTKKVYVKYTCGHTDYNRLCRIVEKFECKQCKRESKSIRHTHPDVMKEIPIEENKNIDFSLITKSSRQKANFICNNCNEIYKTAVRNRMRRKKGACPNCRYKKRA